MSDVWRRKEGRQGRVRKFRLGYFFAKVTHIKLGAKMAERGDREAQRTCRHIFGDENLCGAYKEKVRFGLAKFAIAPPPKKANGARPIRRHSVAQISFEKNLL